MYIMKCVDRTEDAERLNFLENNPDYTRFNVFPEDLVELKKLTFKARKWISQREGFKEEKLVIAGDELTEEFFVSYEGIRKDYELLRKEIKKINNLSFWERIKFIFNHKEKHYEQKL